MRVAVLEFLSGGGLCNDLSSSDTKANAMLFEPLICEGLSMLSALTLDLVLCGHEVHTCLDAFAANLDTAKTQMHHTSLLQVQVVAADWKKRWTETALLCDRTIVIAPELHQQLERIVSDLRAAGAVVVASSVPFIQATSDKLATAKLMHAGNVRHPVTQSLSEFRLSSRGDDCHDESPLTLKRRDGAGCSEMMYFDHQSTLTDWLQSRELVPGSDSDWIVQQWHSGKAASMAVIANDDWQFVGALEQSISIDNDNNRKVGSPVSYRGGCGPIEAITVQQLRSFADQVRNAFPSAAEGWIGIDFIIPSMHCNASDLVFIEVNPRMTTSYLGYRQWYGHHLADCLLGILDVSELLNRRVCPLDRISFEAN